MSDDELTRRVVATPLWGVSTARTRLLKRRTAPWLQRISAFNRSKQRACSRAFTLVELVVTMSVLVLLVFLATQLLNSAATVTTLGHEQMDADSQARQVLDRMAVDFAQMVNRSDVDYYLKSSSGSASDCGVCGAQTGNDQAAFYSTVPGYFPTPTATPAASPVGQGAVSLVSYRINSNSGSPSYNKMERMGNGLAWSGLSTGLTPVVFWPQTIGGPRPPGGNWPSAVSSSAMDSTYEVIGAQVFRFEYYYLLKAGSFSATPWDTAAGHTNVSGMRDVAAIVTDIAVIDPKSQVLVTVSQMEQLAGTNGHTSVLVDYSTGMPPGQLLANWRSTLEANTIGLPPPAISGIRVYERYFYLTH